MTSKSAKAMAVLEHVSDVQGYDHALAIYEELGNTFGPVDDVLDKHDTKRFMLYEGLDGEEFWENIEDTAHTIDDARRHFGE